MNIRMFKTPALRREAVEKEFGVKLTNIGSYCIDDEQASTKNCENMIGAAQIPLGIAGPISINGTNAVGDYYLPLATTEGALVASISRGCKAICESRGALTHVQRVGQTRGPVFVVDSIIEREKVTAWITKNKEKLQQVAQTTSQHLSLQHIQVKSVAHYIFVRFVFDTEDAMGMNMVTIATSEIAAFIEKETGAKCLSVAGNFDSDKKPAWINFVNNRGFASWAEVVLKKEVLEKVLKITAQDVFDVWLGKCMIGSAMSGSMGFNAHYANIIAAMFLATGQDPAHVVEGSMGITITKVLPNGELYVSVYLPALIIGTIGGGTGLATQQEALKLLGVSGDGKVEKFAEIIAAGVLAGEISLLASLAEGSLGKAHKQLGR